MKRDFDPGVNAAGAPRRAEGVTLALAVSVAVAFGVAFGVWLTARLTPTPSAGAPRQASLWPGARASAPAAPAAPEARPSPCDGCVDAPAGEAAPPRITVEKVEAVAPETDSGAPKDAAGATPEASPEASPEPSRPEEVAGVVAETRGATSAEAAAAEASPDPSRPVAWQVGAQPRAGARANAERGAAEVGGSETGGGAQAPSEPCVPYASANSLRVGVGGAAPLILGGPGVGVRVNVSTPDWKELAVIYEGPAGRNGWIKYSVRSIGQRPGLYKVRFSTPCGSQTIPVTVK